jgi:hypothetical protein
MRRRLGETSAALTYFQHLTISSGINQAIVLSREQDELFRNYVKDGIKAIVLE